MKTILFVCTANIARSPMAEALFNHMMRERGWEQQYRAESAATWGMDGSPAASDGQQVMLARGLDISAHRSRSLNQEIIQAADLVLAMEAGQVEALRYEFPAKAGVTHLLSEMAGPPYDIEDPYRRGLDRFEATAQELEALLDKGMARILALAGDNG